MGSTEHHCVISKYNKSFQPFQTVPNEKLVLPEGAEKDNDSGIEDNSHRSGSSNSSKGGDGEEPTAEVRSKPVISNLSSEAISFSSVLGWGSSFSK